jgi:hypothetical protein
MAKTYSTVKIRDYVGIFTEHVASTSGNSIYPGMLVQLNSDNTVQPHSSVNKFAYPMFALEDAMQGNGIDTVYVAGNQVQLWIPTRGDIVYALVLDNEVINVGDLVGSGGNGRLRRVVPTDQSWESIEGGGVGFIAGTDISTLSVIGVALDAVNLTLNAGTESSAGGPEYPRVRIRIL